MAQYLEVDRSELIGVKVEDKQIQKLRQGYRQRGEQLLNLKDKYLKLEISYQKLKAQYFSVYSTTEFKLSSNRCEAINKQFIEKEWIRTLKTSESLKNTYSAFNKERQQGYHSQIQSLKKQIVGLTQKLHQKDNELSKSNHIWKTKLSEMQCKLKQKNKVIKTLFGKIQIDQILQKCQSKLIIDSCKQNVSAMTQTEKEITLYQQENQQFYQSIQILLDQIVKQYFSSFIASILNNKDQPSLLLFQQNLASIDSQKMQTYSKCLSLLLKFYGCQSHLTQEPLTEKERWVEATANSLKFGKDKLSGDTNKSLIYLFRLCSLYYRVLNSLQSWKREISSKVVNRLKLQLFHAFSDYDFSKMQMNSYTINDAQDFII